MLPVLALAAWLLADVVHRIVAEQHRDLPTFAPRGTDPGPDLLPGSGPDPNGEIDGDLFSPQVPPPGPPLPEQDLQDPPQGPGAALPVSALPASLVGTICASDPDWSLALIARAGEQRAAPFRPGDRLAPGASLVSVHADRVVLEHAGRLEVLWLAETTGPRLEVALASAAPLASPVDGDWIQRQGTDQYRLERSRFTQLLTQPERLAREARITLNFDASGRVDGVRLAGIRPDGLLSRLGLARADILRRVNGVALDGPDRMLEIITGLRSAREVDLEINSGGRSRHLHYQID